MNYMAKNKSKNWTLKDIDVLKSLYGTIPNKELARMIGKSKQSIQHKAHRLHLTTLKVADWKYCIDCGHKLSRSSTYKESAKRCRACADDWHSEENHHNWKGGIGKLNSIVHVMLKPVWVDPILRRDHYTCQFCEKHGGDLHVHHILSYQTIRDRVAKENPSLNTRTFEGKKALALKIIEAHKLSYGITLCIPCHKNIHNENGVNCGDLLTGNAEDNPQPSLSNVVYLVDRTVQRPTLEDTQTNKSDTSAPLLDSLQVDEMVRTCGKP